MALKAEKNLFTFNFKKLPSAGILAAGIAVLLELSSAFVMRDVRFKCGGGDLIRLDTDFYCRNFRPLCEADTSSGQSRTSPFYAGWKDMAAGGPYDAVIFGTSVGNTGWAEVLKEEGIKILNTTGSNPVFRGHLPPVFWDLTGHLHEINARPGALLLYSNLTERGDMDLRRPASDLLRNLDPQKPRETAVWRYHSRFFSLWTYIMEKMKIRNHPEAQVSSFGRRTEIFQGMTVEGLKNELPYAEEDDRFLTEQLKSYQEEAARRGFRFALIAFPTKPQMYEWLMPPDQRGSGHRSNLRAIERACIKNGIPFLDLEKELSGPAREHFEKDGTLLWHQCDTHMNETGTKLAAQSIKKFIEENSKWN